MRALILPTNTLMRAGSVARSHPHRSGVAAATGPVHVVENVVRRRYITIAEDAEYLQISERTVRRLIADGELNGYRIVDPVASSGLGGVLRTSG